MEPSGSNQNSLMPADQGAVVAQALDRMAGRMPDIVADADDDAPPSFEGSLEVRRSDALYALAFNRIASDADADRATVVGHAPLEALAGLGGGCETEAGAVLHPDTARRLACDCGSSWCSTIRKVMPSASARCRARLLPG